MPESLAKTSAPEEELAAIDIKLAKLFHLTDSAIHLRISDFLLNTSIAAFKRIDQAFKTESMYCVCQGILSA